MVLFLNFINIEHQLSDEVLDEIANLLTTYDADEITACISQLENLKNHITPCVNLSLLHKKVNACLQEKLRQASQTNTIETNILKVGNHEYLQTLINKMSDYIPWQLRDGRLITGSELADRLNNIINSKVVCEAWQVQEKYLVTRTKDKKLVLALRSSQLLEAFYSHEDDLVMIPVNMNNINRLFQDDFESYFVKQLEYHTKKQQANIARPESNVEQSVCTLKALQPVIDIPGLCRSFFSAFHASDRDEVIRLYEKLKPHLNTLDDIRQANRITKYYDTILNQASAAKAPLSTPTVRLKSNKPNKNKQRPKTSPKITKKSLRRPANSINSKKRVEPSEQANSRQKESSARPIKTTLSLAAVNERYGFKPMLSEQDKNHINIVVKPGYNDLCDILKQRANAEVANDLLYYHTLYIALRFFTSLANLLKSKDIYQVRHIIAHNFINLNMEQLCNVILAVKSNKKLKALVYKHEFTDKNKLSAELTQTSALKDWLSRKVERLSNDTCIQNLFAYSATFLSNINLLNSAKEIYGLSIHAKLEKSPILANACKMLIICIIEMYHKLIKNISGKRHKNKAVKRILAKFNDLAPGDIKQLVKIRNQIAHHRPSSDELEDAQQLFFRVDDVPTQYVIEAKDFIDKFYAYLQKLLQNSAKPQPESMGIKSDKSTSTLNPASPVFRPKSTNTKPHNVSNLHKRSETQEYLSHNQFRSLHSQYIHNGHIII